MTVLLRALDDHQVVIGDRLNGQIAPEAMTRLNFIGNHLLMVCYGPVRRNNRRRMFGLGRRETIHALQLNSQSFKLKQRCLQAWHQGVVFRFVPSVMAPESARQNLAQQRTVGVFYANSSRAESFPCRSCRPCQALKTNEPVGPPCNG